VSRVLITGGSGFIGTNLVQYHLDRGEEVLSIDVNPPQTAGHNRFWKRVDILQEEELRRIFEMYLPEYVYHLAARTDLDEKRSIEGYSANTVGVRNLIRSIKASGTVRRCIFTSTQLVCRVGYIPAGDSDYAPNTLYGESKVIMEKMVKEHDGGGSSWCIIRPTTVWGPWCSPHYRRFLGLIGRGKYFHIGPMDRNKSYGYVENFCHQIRAVMYAAPLAVNGQTFYVADYEPTSLREWAEAISREMEAPAIRTFPLYFATVAAYIGDVAGVLGFRNLPFNSFRLRNIMTEYIFDLSKLRNIAPQLPYTMVDGVRHTVEWYKYFMHR
jgi:nucleoside-diphosphate-sugar epimerase